MVRLVTIHLPSSHKHKIQDILGNLQATGKICQVVAFTGQAENTQIQFKTKDKHLQQILDEVQALGVGKAFGQIDVLPVLLSKPAISFVNQRALEASDGDYRRSSSSIQLDSASGKKKRLYRMDDRMSVDEIGSFIDDGNHLTFNYMMLLFCASLIAGAGLIGDSATTVIAAMLVSPLMGPILSITFGLAVQEREAIRRGLRNEIVGILISFVTGLFIGWVASGLYSPNYRSNEMVERGEATGLAYGFVVAFASGIAVVVAITMGGVNAIVGTAISASLLPPVVNSGICLALATVYAFTGWMSDARAYAMYSIISFSLFMINFVVIVWVGFITFRYIKNVRPQEKDTTSAVNAATTTTNLDASPMHQPNGGSISTNLSPSPNGEDLELRKLI